MARTRKPKATASTLRIIGGQWRGRKLTFSPAPGLRPTTDRVRETLFNWLAPVVHQARCLDLFAGSGALGIEALSRGAAHCDFVDLSAAALGQIRAHLDTLGAAHRGTCHRLPASEFLAAAELPYDIVFVDPPFGLGLVEPTCRLLACSGLLAHGAAVYVESAAREGAAAIPSDWTLHREKTAGAVAYRLFTANCLPSAADTDATGPMP